jgi:hypothetical protein
MELRRFCLVWLVCVLVLVALVGSFDAVVDPYLVIGAPRITGFNAAKPATETHTGLAKSYLIRRAPYAGVMIGSSKVDIGLDPESPSWPADSRPVFNDGVPGVGVSGSLDLLRQAIALGHIRRALVFLEISEFLKPAEPPAPQPPVPTGWSAFSAHAQDIGLATFSLDALWSSLATVAAQGAPDGVDMSPQGATGDGGFRADIAKIGTTGLFAQKHAANAEALRMLAEKLQAHPHAALGHLEELTEIITLCRTHHIALDLVISPFHADYLSSLDAAGLKDRMTEAKQALTQLVAAEPGNIALWDFLGYDAYSTEPIENSGMKWFWEPNHFKRALGEKILASVYRGDKSYGVRLTPARQD